MAYNSLIVVEHLLTHGPESVSDEFQGDTNVISQMQTFQQIDEKGYYWFLRFKVDQKCSCSFNVLRQ